MACYCLASLLMSLLRMENIFSKSIIYIVVTSDALEIVLCR